MLKKRIHDAAVLARILPHVCVLDLQDVDLMRIQLAMDQPVEIGVAEFADRERRQGAYAFGLPFEADEKFL